MPGALVATFAAVLPAFLIIVGIIVFLQHLLTNSYVNAVLQGLKSCVTGIILATGVHMVSKNCLPAGSGSLMPDLRAVAVTAVLAGVYFGLRAWGKKKLSPIQLIGISAVVGMIVYRCEILGRASTSENKNIYQLRREELGLVASEG